MITCKRCAYKFSPNLKREARCPNCDLAVDFGKFKRANRVRLLLKTLYMVTHFVIIFVALSLHSWLHNWLPMPQRLLIALPLWAIAVSIIMFVLLPMAQRIVAKVYYNHDKEV